eukprot:COSAG01_NODE_16439_length_1236_cov_2.543536_1_plen_24_part_10
MLSITALPLARDRVGASVMLTTTS